MPQLESDLLRFILKFLMQDVGILKFVCICLNRLFTVCLTGADELLRWLNWVVRKIGGH